MEGHDIDVEITRYSFGSHIKVNGVDIPGLRAFSITAEVGKASAVVLEFAAPKVRITGAVGKVEEK